MKRKTTSPMKQHHCRQITMRIGSRCFNPCDYPEYLNAKQLHAIAGYPRHLLLAAPAATKTQ